jgi:hypothetical protein
MIGLQRVGRIIDYTSLIPVCHSITIIQLVRPETQFGPALSKVRG